MTYDEAINTLLQQSAYIKEKQPHLYDVYQFSIACIKFVQQFNKEELEE